MANKGYVLIVISCGVGEIVQTLGNGEADILDLDNLKEQSAEDTVLSEREWTWIKAHDEKLYWQLTHNACDCRERSWYGPDHDSACPQNGWHLNMPQESIR